MTKKQENIAFAKMLKEFPKAFGRVSFRERLMLRAAFSYVVEEIVDDIEKENRLLGVRCNQLLKDKGKLTDQIADIKANCDLAIEGRDVKIMELEKENAELKAEIENDRDLPTVAYMQGAEKQKKKDEKQLTITTEIIKEFVLWANWEGANCPNFQDIQSKAEQFLKGENIILEDVQAGNSPFDSDEVFHKEMKAYPEEKVK